jgi:hypothetical protein
LRHAVAQARVHDEQANINQLLSPLQLRNRIGINKLRALRNGDNRCLAICVDRGRRGTTGDQELIHRTTQDIQHDPVECSWFATRQANAPTCCGKQFLRS